MGREDVGDEACSVERASCSKRYIFIIPADRKSGVHVAERECRPKTQQSPQGGYLQLRSETLMPAPAG